jgi:hypothetical protein
MRTKGTPQMAMKTGGIGELDLFPNTLASQKIRKPPRRRQRG